MRKAVVVLGVLVGLLAVGAGADAKTPVEADQLASTDVIVAPGGTATDEQVATLQAAARKLADDDFPTKFVIVPAPAAGQNLDDDARELHVALDVKKVDAVLLLAPRALGIAANAFAVQRSEAFEAERDTLARDPIEGTINIAERLQQYEEDVLLPGETAEDAPKGGIAWWVWAAGGVVILLGLVAMLLARRAAARTASAGTATGSDHPDESSDAPDTTE